MFTACIGRIYQPHTGKDHNAGKYLLFNSHSDSKGLNLFFTNCFMSLFSPNPEAFMATRLLPRQSLHRNDAHKSQHFQRFFNQPLNSPVTVTAL
jgi:hypothetical protein